MEYQDQLLQRVEDAFNEVNDLTDEENEEFEISEGCGLRFVRWEEYDNDADGVTFYSRTAIWQGTDQQIARFEELKDK